MYLTIEDTIDTQARGVLGLTLRCARCHDHKFDHEKLTFRYAGRDFRLTDVHGQVVRGLLS
jgi:hypothetical protein